MTRTVTVEDKKIVVRESGVSVRYPLSVVLKRIHELESELATWREYKRLLTEPGPGSGAGCWYCGLPQGKHTPDCPEQA